jgi:hypothetical protein
VAVDAIRGRLEGRASTDGGMRHRIPHPGPWRCTRRRQRMDPNADLVEVVGGVGSARRAPTPGIRAPVWRRARAPTAVDDADAPGSGKPGTSTACRRPIRARVLMVDAGEPSRSPCEGARDVVGVRRR